MRNKTVAILESRLGEQFGELVAKYGGRPFRAPALAEVPDVDLAYIAALLADLQSRPAKIAIFQTGVGTRALFSAGDMLGLTEQLLTTLPTTLVVVRGPKPTAVLRSRNVRIDLSAKEPYTTSEVLDTLVTGAFFFRAGRQLCHACRRRHAMRQGRCGALGLAVGPYLCRP
jgi:uroporphyrinogen-III synthase